MDTWSLYIDIEGFSFVDEGVALGRLHDLAQGIHAIGSQAFPSVNERLFAYGVGDGFFIVPDLEPPDSERPLAIAIVLMHHILRCGGVAKASLSSGEVADVSSCFSEEVQEGRMGEGLIEISQVIGTAFKSFKLGAQVSGACLVVEPGLFVDLPSAIPVSMSSPMLLDWLHTDWPQAVDLASKAGLDLLSAPIAEQALRRYIESNPTLTPEWKQTTLAGVGCGPI